MKVFTTYLREKGYAENTVRSENRFGEYYRACRGRGMCHGEALKAVARKRLKVIYAIMRDKVPYSA